jgi:CDP-glucose 4,6-dehydratase
VLEPLAGYLLLAQKLWDHPHEYAQSWNFGPTADDIRPVRWIVERLVHHWGEDRVSWKIDAAPKVHEANLLVLDSSKARMMLGWRPRWTLERALEAVVDWYDAYDKGEPLRDIVMRQIDSYETTAPVC